MQELPAGEEPRPGQADTADGLGAAHEQPEGPGGGDRADGAGVQLTETAPDAVNVPLMEEPEPIYEQMTLIFPTEAEQIAQIDHEAESEMPSAFSLPQEDIDHVLRLGGRTEQTRMEVAALFMTGKSPIEIANFLSREYRGGLGLLTDNGRMSAWFGEQGIWLASGDHARDAAPGVYIPWLKPQNVSGS